MVEVKDAEVVKAPRSTGFSIDSPLLPLMVSAMGISLMGLFEQIPKPDSLTAVYLVIGFFTPLLIAFGPGCVEKIKGALAR